MRGGGGNLGKLLLLVAVVGIALGGGFVRALPRGREGMLPRHSLRFLLSYWALGIQWGAVLGGGPRESAVAGGLA